MPVKPAAVLFSLAWLYLAPMQVMAVAECESHVPGTAQQDWLIPDVVSIPPNTAVVEPSQLERHEIRKVAASLVERKRLSDERWSRSSETENSDPSKFGYELISFFPEEFAESLVKNGQLSGHELPQNKERQLDVSSYIKQDLEITDDKEKLQRLTDDGMFMQTRGQLKAAVEIYEKALELAKRVDPDRVKDLNQKITFFKEKMNDPGMASVRELGWERRAELEYLHLGLRIGSEYKGGKRSFANSMLPKYGIVNFTVKTPLEVDRRELTHYGSIIIVYRDELRFRSTFSFGDSTVLVKNETTGLSKSREVKSLMSLDPQNPPVDSVVFVEAQVWGPIDLTDIKEFRVPEGRADLVKILAKSGLPVYSYDRASLGKDPAYVAAGQLGVNHDSLLYKGDPTLMEKYDQERLQRLGR